MVALRIASETWDYEAKETMLYAITNRRLYARNEALAREQLLKQTAVWAANGVAFIQLREKDLSARDQVELARAMLTILNATARLSGSQRIPRLLINGRPDVALAAGADGVHLPADPDALTPSEVRNVFSASGRGQPPGVSISCHTLQEVETACQLKPDCILFAPVFEKMVTQAPDQEFASQQSLPGTGLELLEIACRIAAPVPVLALGGITMDNAPQCIEAGAGGIAAIRLMLKPASVWLPLA